MSGLHRQRVRRRRLFLRRQDEPVYHMTLGEFSRTTPFAKLMHRGRSIALGWWARLHAPHWRKAKR